jgi:predicted Zn-dependent protease
MSYPPASSRPPHTALSRRRGLIPLLLLIAAALSAWFFWLAPSRERTAALELARKGEFELARPGLNRSLERRPEDAEVLEALTRGSLSAEDDFATMDLLDRWVAAAPTDPQALRLRMEQRTKRREYDAALTDGLALREQRSTDAELLKQVLNLAISAARFETAEQLCREALRAEPGDIGLRIRLAGIRTSRADTNGAATMLEGVLQDRPGHTGAMQVLAMLYNDLGQPEKAIPLLRKILDTDPNRQRTAGYQLSLALERTGHPEEARKVLAEVRRRQDLEVFREALQGQPDNLELRVRLGESLILDGHVNDGLVMLDEVFARDPAFAPAHRVLAEHYGRTGDAAKAERHRKLAGSP